MRTGSPNLCFSSIFPNATVCSSKLYIDLTKGALDNVYDINGKASPAEKLRFKRLKLDLEEMRLAQKAEKIAQRKRAEKTKMKIILGAWVLDNSDKPEMRAMINKTLATFLSEKDRLFFDEFLKSIA